MPTTHTPTPPERPTPTGGGGAATAHAETGPGEPDPRGRGARWLLPWWVAGYRLADLRADALAGLTVAVLLVPQALAYAALADLPPVVGLWAATLPLLAYALVGTSGQLAIGPVAIVALLTASAVGPRADGDPATAVALAGALALMAGGLQLALGLLRLGRVAAVLSHPVVLGFTSGAAIVIALTQVPGLLGIDAPRSADALGAASAAAERLGQAHPASLAVGTLAVVALLVGGRLLPRATPLLVLVLATGASALLGLAGLGVSVVGEVPAGLPAPTLPAVSSQDLVALLPAAAAIALIGFAEGLSVARALAERTGARISADRELVATGLANIAAGTMRAMPVAGGFSRSAVNHQAGARTPVAGLVTAGLMVVVALALTPLLEPLPQPVLAAVIVTAVLRLVSLRALGGLLRRTPGDGIVAVTTFAATLALGVEAGLAVGIAAGLLHRGWQRARHHRHPHDQPEDHR